MRFDGEEDAVIVDGPIVDGHVTARQESAQSAGPKYSPAGNPRIYNVEQSYDPYFGTQAVDPGGFDITGLVDVGMSAAADPRVRGLSTLIKVPLLTYVALNSKLPPIIRLGAVVLGVLEVLPASAELAQEPQP